ncbi:MAG: hypothetical protein methR_P2152 [Methyloprofundus sp.]|nr:MAG: hypothetical protein methR_P2152 [Methyloprofundus sp.]
MLRNDVRLKFSHSLSMSILVTALCCAQLQLVFAESLAEVLVMGAWQIKAKPRICVKPSIRPMCTMSTDLIWSGSVNADICLLSSQTQARIKCWTDVQTGDILQEINSDIAITYWISHFGENAVLAETTVRIVTVPQRQIRRRRRHIWSLL